MVNRPATLTDGDRRQRMRDAAEHAPAFGASKLNPFGDLHTVQHVSARLARGARAVFEPILRHEVRCWAEPLSVERFADYRQERGDALTAWVPLTMAPAGGRALMVADGRFVLELLDLFFGGTGAVPKALPGEFSAAAEAMAVRLAGKLAQPLAAAWEPLTRITFAAGAAEANPAAIADLDADDAVIATRIGIATGDGEPRFVDLIYPVSALKPHAAPLTGKVLAKTAEPDPSWRAGLTRAVMGVTFPVRSVLAEPTISLARLMELKVGDVIPIGFETEVPVMVGADRLGLGTVGTSNGRAAIRINSIERLLED